MILFHDSHDTRYRLPFGAVPTGTSITLKLKASGEIPRRALLRVFFPNNTRTFEMSAEGTENNTVVYSAEISVGEVPCLLWYDFLAEYADKTVCFSDNTDRYGGIGRICSPEDSTGYQITVYDKDFHTPRWFGGNIMYQIFPDRFYGSHPDGQILKKRDEYTVHYDRYEGISFDKHPYEDGPACNDFYGGNLNGIKEKLPYLQSLGIGVIYLNPIFEAYSNHKYDTADYKKIDSMFGTEEDFCNLCREADKYGIRIILDGVFSHTGADSIYFNKYGTYGEHVGAYRDRNSPYASWYSFGNFPTEYESWWGCSNLPNVKETEPSYLDYIIRDEDSVIKKWVKCGASGWRLDVADELPDEFIRIFRSELKKTSSDAVLIGEVWEDASNKIAYGKQREYMLGKELDSVMNYPFKDWTIDFIMNNIPAEEMNARIMSQIENYPTEALYCMMNIIGTHDTMRIKSLFGGMNDDCGTAKLNSGCEELAVYRIKLASFMQMTFYGVPCIYYGDEAGAEGGKDPYNRGVFPWRAVDFELIEWYRKIGNLRNSLACLKSGFFRPIYADADLYVYERFFKDGKDVYGDEGDGGYALCAVNRAFEPRTVNIKLDENRPKILNGFISGKNLSPKNEIAEITLRPLECEIFLKQ